MGPQALRSSSLEPFDEVLTGLKDAEEQKIKDEDSASKKVLNEIASLKNHPGWRTVKKSVIDPQLENYRSGSYWRSAMDDPKVSDAEIGQMGRVGYLVASELERILTLIENAGADDE